jgi:cyanobactin maturation PatA/PatG family protease
MIGSETKNISFWEQFWMDIHSLQNQAIDYSDVTIAVLDSPVNLRHSSIINANIRNLSTNTHNDVIGQGFAHGTHVSSVIFGQRGTCVEGVAPDCKGLIIPIYGIDDRGELTGGSQESLAEALHVACDNGADIINISGGQLSNTGEAGSALIKAIERCNKQDILIVAAVGNDGCECLNIPASLPLMLAVGAMTRNGVPLKLSNWGNVYHQQGILAPGEGIMGANIFADCIEQSGTSFATPLVTGIAALLLGIRKTLGRKLSPIRIRQALLETVTPCPDENDVECSTYLAGQINIKGAYKWLLEGYQQPNELLLVSSKKENDNYLSNEKDRFKKKVAIYDLLTNQTNNMKEPILTPENVVIEPKPSYSNINGGNSIEQNITENSQDDKGKIMPSGCGCQNNIGESNRTAQEAPRKAYVLGTIGYDLVSPSRRTYFQQQMTNGNPDDPIQMLKFLKASPYEAARIMWTINIDGIPAYVIEPSGPFASLVFDRLQEFLTDQVNSQSDRVALPGSVYGTARTMSGLELSVLTPEVSGMFNWNTQALLKAVGGKATNEKKQVGLQNFLDRIYFQLRNIGIKPEDRALNYAATNAHRAGEVFEEAVSLGLSLDKVTVERSAISPPGEQYFDVNMQFFNPTNIHTQARKNFAYTINVSDIIPVNTGKIRTWDVF